MSHSPQFFRQFPQALGGPTQRRFRIAARDGLDQPFQIPQQRRVLSQGPLPSPTGAANATRRMDARFAQLRHTLADDLPRHAHRARDRRDATAPNGRAFRGCHQPSGAFIRNPAHCREAPRNPDEVYHPPWKRYCVPIPKQRIEEQAGHHRVKTPLDPMVIVDQISARGPRRRNSAPIVKRLPAQPARE